jgi:hypothetical protein
MGFQLMFAFSCIAKKEHGLKTHATTKAWSSAFNLRHLRNLRFHAFRLLCDLCALCVFVLHP